MAGGDAVTGASVVGDRGSAATIVGSEFDAFAGAAEAPGCAGETTGPAVFVGGTGVVAADSATTGPPVGRSIFASTGDGASSAGDDVGNSVAGVGNEEALAGLGAVSDARGA